MDGKEVHVGVSLLITFPKREFWIRICPEIVGGRSCRGAKFFWITEIDKKL